MRSLLSVLVFVVGMGIARADQIDTLARTAEGDSSEKARIAAVVALGRLADPRTFRPLVQALRDPSPVVRGVAASALGHLGDARAVPSLEKVLDDGDDGVRERAREAIRILRSGTVSARAAPAESMPTKARFAPRELPRRRDVVVAVNRMGHKAPSSQHLTARMHDLVVSQLATAPGVSVTPGGGAELIVDGAITRLSREMRGPYLEITCEVKLTVSNASGSLLSIVSGGATVQASRNTRTGEGILQVEALDSAVRGVQPNLLGFLARQGDMR